jgi:hypothetical protein
MNEAPVVEVHTLDSRESPGGIVPLSRPSRRPWSMRSSQRPERGCAADLSDASRRVRHLAGNQ